MSMFSYNMLCFHTMCIIVRGSKAMFGVNLALGSIKCFIIDPIAPESVDFKSAGCEAVTLGDIELFKF